MIKRICDKCGKEITEYKFHRVEFHPTNGFVIEESVLNLDICRDCYNNLFDKEGKLNDTTTRNTTKDA